MVCKATGMGLYFQYPTGVNVSTIHACMYGSKSFVVLAWAAETFR